MATPPISDELAQEALDLLTRHGERGAARITGIPHGTLANRARRAKARGMKPFQVVQNTSKLEFKKELKSTRFFITAAQNATPIHGGFLRALQTACKKIDAQLVVVPIRYKNPTSQWTENNRADDWWHDGLVPYLCNERKALCKNLTLLGDIKTQPTAESPLSGFETLTHSESAILAHPRLQLKTVPTPSGKLPKILTTTGSITVQNYTDTKSGKKGDFHHTFGACFVEIRGDEFHLRQINAERNGSFIDLDKRFTCDGKVQKAPPALALAMGDTHVDSIDPDVVQATFIGDNSIVSTLTPAVLVWHDVLDGYSCNPHHHGNVFSAIAKRKFQRHHVAAEVYRAIDFIDRYTRKGCKSVVVSSNHDDFLARWVRNSDWRQDPDNAEFYLETALALVRSTTLGPGGLQVAEPFSYWVNERIKSGRVRCLRRDESFTVAGIELGYHGDRGPNGARGSLKGMRAIGPKVVIGHCLTGEHDVLTKNGWEPIANVQAGVELMSWRDGKNEWQQSTEKQFFNYSGRLVRIRHTGAFDQEVTVNHKLQLKDGRAVNVCDAILTESASDLPVSALPADGTLSVPERTIRMVVAICADAGGYGGQWKFNFKKSRKLERLSWLFGDSLNPVRHKKHGVSSRTVKTQSAEHALVAEWVDTKDKRLPNAWINLTKECREILLDELRHWDGTFFKRSDTGANQFSTYKESEANLVAALVTASGYRCTLHKRPDSRGFIISWNGDRDYSFCTAKEHDKARMAAWGATTRTVQNEPVYCFTLPNGCFWVRSRRTGLVSLTHNSHSPGIEQGAYQTGTSTLLDLEYLSGPSSWLHTHCVIYANGKRCLINIIKGKWR